MLEFACIDLLIESMKLFARTSFSTSRLQAYGNSIPDLLHPEHEDTGQVAIFISKVFYFISSKDMNKCI